LQLKPSPPERIPVHRERNPLDGTLYPVQGFTREGVRGRGYRAAGPQYEQDPGDERRRGHAEPDGPAEPGGDDHVPHPIGMEHGEMALRDGVGNGGTERRAGNPRRVEERREVACSPGLLVAVEAVEEPVQVVSALARSHLNL
jgi:hypothetical protein